MTPSARCGRRARRAILRERGALVYVGDDPADVTAAHSAGALAVGVTTGRHDAAALAAADVVLPALTAFPDWLGTVATTAGP